MAGILHPLGRIRLHTYRAMTREDLETLVRMHQAELYRYVRYLGAESPSVAEDLTQETFLAAFRSPDLGTVREPKQQAAWLRGIARNQFLAHCRRVRANPVTADSSSVAMAEATWVGDFLEHGDGFEYVEALRQCLGKLEGRNRHVLELHYGEGKSRAELATVCQMTEDGIKSLMRRLRTILAECVKRRLAGEEHKPLKAE